MLSIRLNFYTSQFSLNLKWLAVRLWWKDVFILSRAWDEEKILSPHKESMFSSDVLSSFLYRAQKLTFSLISIYKHYAYRYCWSKQYSGRVSYELRNRPRSPESLCGSVVRASQRWNLKVWGSIRHGTQNFFFLPRSWQDENIFSTVYNKIILKKYYTNYIMWVKLK